MSLTCIARSGDGARCVFSQLAWKQAAGTSLDTWMALLGNCFAGPSTMLTDLNELAYNDDTPGSEFDNGLCSTIVYTWTAGTAPSTVYLFIEGAWRCPHSPAGEGCKQCQRSI
jgi:hypothetical protein